jgi:hypothetical protein
MRRIHFIILVFIAGLFVLKAQHIPDDEVFYYYQGEKIFLTERTDDLTAGTYLYTLIVDNMPIDTKRMILTE